MRYALPLVTSVTRRKVQSLSSSPSSPSSPSIVAPDMSTLKRLRSPSLNSKMRPSGIVALRLYIAPSAVVTSTSNSSPSTRLTGLHMKYIGADVSIGVL